MVYQHSSAGVVPKLDRQALNPEQQNLRRKTQAGKDRIKTAIQAISKKPKRAPAKV